LNWRLTSYGEDGFAGVFGGQVGVGDVFHKELQVVQRSLAADGRRSLGVRPPGRNLLIEIAGGIPPIGLQLAQQALGARSVA
jgi:hypothetical protein